MGEDKSIAVCRFPDVAATFMGICTSEPCTCCGKEDKESAYVVKINGERNDTRMVLCAECLNSLYNEIGRVLNG